MCLSTAYKNEMTDSKILMKNVMTVECTPETVILTDLFGHRLEVCGMLLKASLTDGYVVINSKE